jgi:formate-dependent nitrite reductase membrane component NrfD
MPTYDIFHVPSLDLITVLYFFFGGLTAGSFLLSFWAGYGKENLRHLAKISAVIATISLMIGLLLLVFHLERPFQFWRILITFKPTSTTSWGAWILNIFFVVSVLYSYFWLREKPAAALKLGYIGLPLVIYIGMYTGFLLMQMSGNPLWESALLPWMFLVSGLISAIAVAIVVLTVMGHKPIEPFFGLRRYLCTLIIIELLMVGSEFIALYTGSVEAVETANLLLVGKLSAWFIGLEIILGAFVPLGLLIISKTSKNAALNMLVSVLLLAGVLTMRCVVVLAGQGSL